MRRLREAWINFLVGLTQTRQQTTYAIVGVYLYIVLQGLGHAKTVADTVALLNAMTPSVMAVMVFWFGGRWLEAKASAKNGGLDVSQNPDIPSEDPLARLERMEDA